MYSCTGRHTYMVLVHTLFARMSVTAGRYGDSLYGSGHSGANSVNIDFRRISAKNDSDSREKEIDRNSYVILGV